MTALPSKEEQETAAHLVKVSSSENTALLAIHADLSIKPNSLPREAPHMRGIGMSRDLAIVDMTRRDMTTDMSIVTGTHAITDTETIVSTMNIFLVNPQELEFIMITNMTIIITGIGRSSMRDSYHDGMRSGRDKG